ncbi:excisionase family DNA-binding protein [Bacillus solitudinis]|uniref:excisionase family DNA-binding protein n=1 Tax=Bacillus solitudinis TaxID=2014074 RepID=UPI000C230AC3|nr:excisionase family DNA-binding protein [Bacillus solitudinis]
MYVKVAELAAYLNLSEGYVYDQIKLGHIKAVFDGKEYLINKEQFIWHKEQLDLKRIQLAQEQQEPLPEDWDAKDED